MTFDNIIQAFDKHINSSGKRFYSEFCIGISDDIENRLFGAHKVDRKNSWWIYARADSPHIASDVKKHYDKLGMRLASGGEDAGSTLVYCYAVTPTTAE